MIDCLSCLVVVGTIKNNIGCIEMPVPLGQRAVGGEIKNNIGCIEMGDVPPWMYYVKLIKNNIGCIEIYSRANGMNEDT